MEQMDIIRSFAEQLRNRELKPMQVWQEAEKALLSFYDITLFTVLFYDKKTNLLWRLFSNNQTINAIGGKKRATNSKWSVTVLKHGEVFIAPDKSALMEVFSDAPFLISYGCESVLNVPVKYQGRVIGSLNLLHKEHSYDRGNISPALIISQMLVPYLLDAGVETGGETLPGKGIESV